MDISNNNRNYIIFVVFIATAIVISTYLIFESLVAPLVLGSIAILAGFMLGNDRSYKSSTQPRIFGNVYDGKNYVENAVVSIVGQNINTKTNHIGYFSLEPQAKESYEVKAEFNGKVGSVKVNSSKIDVPTKIILGKKMA